MMICKNCKTDFNGTFCPKCGQKVENKLFDNLKRFMYDDSENIISVLGNNTAQTFISTGVLGNGFAILSDKRVYFKGKCLIRKGKGFYSKIEEKSVDVKDITGTGFVHNKATWAKVLRIIALVFSIYASVFMTFLLIPVIHGIVFFSLSIFFAVYVDKSPKMLKFNVFFIITYLLSYVFMPDGADRGEMYFFFGLIHNDSLSSIAFYISGISFIVHIVLFFMQIFEVRKIKKAKLISENDGTFYCDAKESVAVQGEECVEETNKVLTKADNKI